jgi:hypothetical protein
MTRTTNARAAGAAYILYFVAGIGSMALASRAPAIRDVLIAITPFCALALGVTLYALTRDVDRDLAMLAMVCRVVEAGGGNGELFFAAGSTIFCWLLLRGRLIPAALAWIGLASSAGLVMLLVTQKAIGARTDWSSPVTWSVWLPMLVFELTFAAWLLTKPMPLPSPATA